MATMTFPVGTKVFRNVDFPGDPMPNMWNEEGRETVAVYIVPPTEEDQRIQREENLNFMKHGRRFVERRDGEGTAISPLSYADTSYIDLNNWIDAHI